MYMSVPQDIIRIREAIYGEEVRGAIADAIQEMYDQLTFAGIAFDKFAVEGTSLVVVTRTLN